MIAKLLFLSILLIIIVGIVSMMARGIDIKEAYYERQEIFMADS